MLDLSFSRVKTYQHCPRQYYYGYVLKLPHIRRDYHVLGEFVHRVLELWLRQGYSKELLQASFTRVLKERLGRELTRFNKLLEAKRLVKEYYEKFTPPVAIKGCEQKFRFPVSNGTYAFRIRGVIDRIDEIDSDTYLVLDYKTSKNIAYVDPLQLKLYVLVTKLRFKDKNIKAGYVFLRHGSQTAYAFTDEELEGAIENIVQTGEAMLADKQWHINRGPLCNYCDYQSRCYSEAKQ